MKSKNKKEVLGNKMTDDPGKQWLEQPRGEMNYENRVSELNDLTLLVHQLAIFHKTDLTIYKLNAIDFVGGRFECSGYKKSRWASFNDAWLFNFTVKEEFEHFYLQYAQNNYRADSREKMIEWLSQSRSRLGYTFDNTQKSTDPAIVNSKRK